MLVDKNMGKAGDAPSEARQVAQISGTTEALSTSKALQILLDSLPEVVVLCTIDGKILLLNAAAERHYRTYYDSLEDLNVFATPNPHHSEVRKANAANVAATKQPIQSTIKVGNSWLNTRIFPVVDDEDNVQFLAVFSMDVTAKREEEMELAKSQLRLATLMKQLPQVVLYETGGGREYISDNLMELIGFPASAFMTDRTIFPQLIHPEDNPRMRDQIKAWHAAGEPGPLRLEFRCRTASGVYKWLEDLMTEVRPQGEPSYMAGILVDISERKRAEAALERSEANLALAQQLAHIGHWEYDYTSDRLVCSEELLKIFDVSQEDVNTRAAFFSYVLPEDQPALLAAFVKARESREVSELEYRVRLKSGAIRNVHGTGRVFFDDHGNPERIFGTGHDVTDIRSAQAALRHSEQRFRDISYSIGDIVWEFDTLGVITYCSEHSKELLGYAHTELIGKAWLQVFGGEQTDDLDKIIKAYAYTPRVIVDREHEITSASGKRLWLITNAVPITDEYGRVLGCRGVSRDITDRRKSEEAVRESELRSAELAALQALSATYAHEINNPLTGIMALLQMLQDTENATERKEMLGEAIIAAKRIGEVTAKLQIVSNPEYRQYLKESRIIDLRE